MLGEHFYIEKDLGLTADGSMQLPSYYIMGADTEKPYVFADKNGKIERAYLTLGKYNKQTKYLCHQKRLGVDGLYRVSRCFGAHRHANIQRKSIGQVNGEREDDY